MALPQASVAVACANTGAAGHSMVLTAGSAAITGAVWSSTLIVWLAVLLLLQASVAVQVRVTEIGGAPGREGASLEVSAVALPQASVAVACANTGAAGHSMVLTAGSA